MRIFLSLAMLILFPCSVFGASISSLDFMEDETVKEQVNRDMGEENGKTFKYVEQPEPSQQVIINNNRGSDIIIQKKSSKVFRHSGSKGSEARNNIGGLKTNQ